MPKKPNFVLVYDMEDHTDVDYSSYAIANGKDISNGHYFWCMLREDAPSKAQEWIDANPDKTPGILFWIRRGDRAKVVKRYD